MVVFRREQSVRTLDSMLFLAFTFKAKYVHRTLIPNGLFQ